MFIHFCVVVLQAPKQFQNFKYETAEAIEGRKRVKQLGDELRVRDKKLKVEGAAMMYASEFCFSHGQ